MDFINVIQISYVTVHCNKYVQSLNLNILIYAGRMNVLKINLKILNLSRGGRNKPQGIQLWNKLYLKVRSDNFALRDIDFALICLWSS